MTEDVATNFYSKVVIRNTKKLLKAQNRKGKDLAAYLGIRESTFSNWERRNQSLSIDTVFKIAKTLNVTIYKLLDDSQDDSGITLSNPGKCVHYILNNIPVSSVMNSRITKAVIELADNLSYCANDNQTRWIVGNPQFDTDPEVLKLLDALSTEDTSSIDFGSVSNSLFSLIQKYSVYGKTMELFDRVEVKIPDFRTFRSAGSAKMLLKRRLENAMHEFEILQLEQEFEEAKDDEFHEWEMLEKEYEQFEKEFAEEQRQMVNAGAGVIEKNDVPWSSDYKRRERNEHRRRLYYLKKHGRKDEYEAEKRTPGRPPKSHS